ncbi:dexamethasone-induced Ras-related protein 1 [Aphelenchoides avenae]|nr:dexamethasone-induced Ras-related protein 1 [Aphelenchus avenae]
MSLISRRSIRDHKLVRLPSKGAGDLISYADGSCPNSPAVKKVFRLVVVGSAQTGKSAIVNRFLGKEFDERYLPTIENFHRKLYKLRGDVYQLDILDRSGNDPFPAARKLSYITGDIFILVSSVDHPQSVEQMIESYQQIVECKASRGLCATPILFVLNKTDLPKSRWQVELSEVEAAVTAAVSVLEPPQTHADCMVSCSAALDENIDAVFGKLFTLGKLPKHMNPQFHKMLRAELSADGALKTEHNNNEEKKEKKKPVLRRMRSKLSKESEDEVFVDVNARRPSLRTDLLLNRTKSAAGGLYCDRISPRIEVLDSKRCAIM